MEQKINQCFIIITNNITQIHFNMDTIKHAGSYEKRTDLKSQLEYFTKQKQTCVNYIFEAQRLLKRKDENIASIIMTLVLKINQLPIKYCGYGCKIKRNLCIKKCYEVGDLVSKHCSMSKLKNEKHERRNSKKTKKTIDSPLHNSSSKQFQTLYNSANISPNVSATAPPMVEVGS